MSFCISKNAWGSITVTESLMFWQQWWWGLCFSVSGLTVGLDSDLKEFLDLTSTLTIRSFLIVHNHLVQLFVFVKWILMNVIKKTVTSLQQMTPSHSLSLKTANVTSANPFLIITNKHTLTLIALTHSCMMTTLGIFHLCRHTHTHTQRELLCVRAC